APCVLLPFVRKTPASPPAVALIVALVAEFNVHVAGESAKHLSLPPAIADEVMLSAAMTIARCRMCSSLHSRLSIRLDDLPLCHLLYHLRCSFTLARRSAR